MNNMVKLRGAKSRYMALLPSFILAFTLTAKAQEKTTQVIEPEEEVIIVYPGDFEIIAEDKTQDPLVLVEGELYEDWKNIDPSIIKSMTVYKAEGDTVSHYSAIYEAAKYGVIKIELQEGKKQKPYKRKTVSSEEANEQGKPNSIPCQTFWERNPSGLKNVKYHQMHKDAETIAKYSQFPEAKNDVDIIITDKE